MDPEEVDQDQLEAVEFTGRAVDAVMRTLDVLPGPLMVRPDAGVALLQISRGLGVWYSESAERGPQVAVLALLDGGRMVPVGLPGDPEGLCWALVQTLDLPDAERLLGEYQAARP